MEKHKKNWYSACHSILRLAVGLVIMLSIVPGGGNDSGWLISSVKACSTPPIPPTPPSSPGSGVTDPEGGLAEGTSPEETKETGSGNDNAATGADPILLRTGEFTFTRHDAAIGGRGLEFPIVRYYRGQPVSAEQTDYTPWIYYKWSKYKSGYTVSLNSFSVTPSAGSQTTDLSTLGFSSSQWVGKAFRFEPEAGTTYTLQMQIRVTKSGYTWYRSFTEVITIPELPNFPDRYVSCLSRGSENTSPMPGWTMSFDMHLIEYPVQDEIHFHAGNGNTYIYTSSVQSDPVYGTVWRCPKTQDFLKKWSDGTYTIVRTANELLNFDGHGYIRKFIQKGQTVEFFYVVKDTNEDNTLDKYGANDTKCLDYILDDCQRRTNFYYADADETYPGNLTSIVDWRGNTWGYDYYTTGNLKSVTDPNGFKETYFYTQDGYLEKVEDGDGNVWLENHYNTETGRIDSQTLDDVTITLTYDGDTAVETDPNGVDTTYVMDENGLTLSKSVETETGAVTTYFEYDDYGERTKIVYPEGNGYDFAYDEKGNLTLISQVSSKPQDPNLTVALTYEDRYHQIKSVTDPRGYTTTYTYDYEDPNYTTDRGLLVRIAYPEVDTDAGLQRPQVCVSYNSYNQVETVTGPDGIVLKYEYCEDTSEPTSLGLVKKVIFDYGDPNYANITYTYTYNGSGRVVDVNDPTGAITTLTYNALDLLTEIENPAGHVTKMTYTADRRLAKMQRGFEAGWQEVDFGYNIMAKLNHITDSLGRESVVDYDDRQLVSAVTDANGNTTSKRYNTRKLVKEIIDAENGSTRFDYDDNGQLAVITDAEDAETEYAYDGYGRLDTVTYADDSYEQYGYDASSNLTSFRNRADETITFEYDALNRLSWKKVGSDPNIVMSYDIAGRLVDVSQDTDQMTFDFDRLGRLEETTDQNGYTVGYEYDDMGRRTKLVYPDDSFITYEYDNVGRLETIKDDNGYKIVEYVYDSLSRTTDVLYSRSGSFVGSMQYDFEDANSLNDDNLGSRIERIDYCCNPPHSISYTYDNVGNVTSTDVGGNYGWAYGYDNTYQVTYADQGTATNRSVDFGYDSVYNRTWWTDTLGSIDISYTDNALNQYTDVDGTTPTYDSRGNLTSGYGGGLTLTYDAENRLVSAGAVSYTYDLQGRRLSRTYSTSTTTYVYDGPHIIAEYSGTGSLIRKYIYGPGIDNPVAMIRRISSTDYWYYYYADALGNIRLLTDAGGVIKESYTYDVYGQPRVMRAAGGDGNWLTEDVTTYTTSFVTIGNPIMFTGRWWDSTTKLYYYRFRDYAPELGRFLQTDPLGYWDTMNLYQYCFNSPMNWIDPWGLEGKECQKGFWEKAWEKFTDFVGLLLPQPVKIPVDVARTAPDATEAVSERSKRNADLNVGMEMLGENPVDETWHERNGEGGGYDKRPNDPLRQKSNSASNSEKKSVGPSKK